MDSPQGATGPKGPSEDRISTPKGTGDVLDCHEDTCYFFEAIIAFLPLPLKTKMEKNKREGLEALTCGKARALEGPEVGHRRAVGVSASLCVASSCSAAKHSILATVVVVCTQQKIYRFDGTNTWALCVVFSITWSVARTDAKAKFYALTGR